MTKNLVEQRAQVVGILQSYSSMRWSIECVSNPPLTGDILVSYSSKFLSGVQNLSCLFVVISSSETVRFAAAKLKWL